MATTEADTKSVIESGSLPDTDGERDLRRRVNLEANLTAACGYGKKKQELVDSFWSIVWTGLAEQGWTKIEGTGSRTGSIQFFPPNVTRASGKKGIDYYDKIRAVIDRVLEKRNEAETIIADALLKERSQMLNNLKAREKEKELKESSNFADGRPKRAAGSRRAGRFSLASGSNNMIDLSWKDGGSSYPKRSSRVGEEYQATELPEAEPFQKDESPKSDYYCDQTWDPKMMEGKDIEKFMADKVPPNKKEETLAAIHANEYSMNNMNAILSKIDPIDGSDWTQFEKDKFHTDIFKFRKDMRSVSRSMNKSMKSCLTYYLGTFKKSDDYRLLKTIVVEERIEKTAASAIHGFDSCAICGDGGSLLICDGCEGEYHMGCLRPALKSIPEGNWECDECVDQKLLDARHYIIRYSTLYERVDAETKKRKASDQSEDSDDDDQDILFRPSSPVLKAMKTFASSVSKALSVTQEQLTASA